MLLLGIVNKNNIGDYIMLITVFLTGVALSMDAFAVAVCKGLKMQKLELKQMGIIALFFGGFQALMPMIGWFLRKGLNEYIEGFSHWISFGLLLFIGGKMIYESFKGDDDDCGCFNVKELFVMAIATSIDAMATGIAFPNMGVNSNGYMIVSICIIGLTTFVFSAIGVLIGHKFGEVYKNKAELAGGIILILIGVKILLEGLEIIKIDLF